MKPGPDGLFHCPLCADDVDHVERRTGYCIPCATSTEAVAERFRLRHRGTDRRHA